MVRTLSRELLGELCRPAPDGSDGEGPATPPQPLTTKTIMLVGAHYTALDDIYR